MRRIAGAILRLYPSAWRERYLPELTDLLADRSLRALDLVDLLAGALDAWLHPQPLRPVPLMAASVAPARSVAAAAAIPRYGAVASPGAGTLSRRAFLRRMLGAGVGLLLLEFIGGTIAFLWPPPADGIGVLHKVGTVDDIIARSPEWATGRPWEFRLARAFLINVPAAKALASGTPQAFASPGEGDILALWRKCPHLGCMIPAACETRHRFQCFCHQSTYNILGEKLELGPAPRGMDRFPVSIDAAGVVTVDTREIIGGPPAGQVTFRDPFPQNVGCA